LTTKLTDNHIFSTIIFYFMQKNFLLLLLCTVVFSLSAQKNVTLSGSIKDDKTGELLIGATITTQEAPDEGTLSNDYGFYSLTLKEGTYTFVIQYLGYQDLVKKMELKADQRMDWELLSGDIQSDDVIITDVKVNENVSKTEMGVQKLDIQEINKVPVLFGERDILKTIQLLPGIKSAGEGNSGFYVRGGGSDQNLVLLDEAPVYNASHLLGFFSVFNSDAIKDMTIYKGGMPAEYGGRLSSVLDITMKDGNNKKFTAEGGIGLIASRLTVSGPLKKEKGSFIVSSRRTYADVFLKLSKNENVKDAKLYFYDFNTKLNYQFGQNDRVYVSGYFGRDNFGVNNLFGFDWGNKTATARWNHIFSDKFFSNTSAIYTDYNYKISLTLGEQTINITSGIQDFNFKQDFQYFPNNKSTIKFGVNSIYHTFIPGVVEVEGNSSFNNQVIDKQYAWENAAYGSLEHKFSKHFNMNMGLRMSAFSLLGPGSFYNYDANGAKTDSTVYAKGKIGKTYLYAEPRLAGNWIMDELNSVKFSLSRNVQNVHLLSNSAIGTPTDRWIPTSLNVKSGICDQASVGYFRNFWKNKLEFSVETYYKTLQNQIDYKNGANLFGNPNVEADLVYGKGRAYGLELYLRKKVGRFTGWISYTLSRTERQFDKINNGKYFAAKQDRTHDISLVGMFDVTPKFNVSATWVYYTGNAITLQSGKYQVNGQVTPYYTERNGYRMPAYHRLDLGANWDLKKTEKFTSSLSFSVYNAYGRKNAYSIASKEDVDTNLSYFEKTYLFRWVPAVTYNFKF
jgi:CarboxypepD_reg-like domain/TonB dependent receptor/TonB-dependent Receptor Plug Domain